MVVADSDGGHKLTINEFNLPKKDDFPNLSEATEGVAKSKYQKSNEELALKRKKKQEEIDKLPTKGKP